MAGFEIKDGEYTKTIYAMIKEQRLVLESTLDLRTKNYFRFVFKVHWRHSSSVHYIRFSSNIKSLLVSFGILLLLYSGKSRLFGIKSVGIHFCANYHALTGAGLQLRDRENVGNLLREINISPTYLQYISNKMPTSTFYQEIPHQFPINSLQIIKFSSFHPRPNQHFVNGPTFYQHTLLCPACKLSKWLMWGICWENVDIGHLASDLTLSLILGGENVGNM